MIERRIRHTKIVCTIGPASSDPVVLREMILAGMNVARLNMSHGTHEEHGERITLLRSLSEELQLPLAIIADLQGPKIRIGKLDGERDLVTGTEVTLRTRNIPAPEDLVDGELPVPLDSLSMVVAPGSQVMLNDGAVRLRVISTDIAAGLISCRVEEGGAISSHKGLNLPGVELDIPPLTKKDFQDLAFVLEHDIDYVAMSFVRGPGDIELLRTHIAAHDNPHKPQIIAKIEKRVATERLNDIISASDAVMVARGDLGVELGAAEVPLLQKRMIKRACETGVPVITATQMLETMTTHPEPTRAEASDVANAVLDGTSAVMLSAETAAGRYPVEAVRVLDKIARAVEPAMEPPGSYLATHRTTSIPQALSEAACEIGELLDATAIVVLTETGRTARQVARNRPRRPVLAAAVNLHAYRWMALYWGIVPLLVPTLATDDANDLWGNSALAVQLSGLVRDGERVVYTAGTIANQPGMTNMLKVEQYVSQPVSDGTPLQSTNSLPAAYR